MDYRLNFAKDLFSYYASILIMALIEMVYYSPLLSLLVSLPDSLGPLHIIAWSDDQATEIVNAIAIIKMALTLFSHFSYSETLLGNLLPTLSPCPNYMIKSLL
jgi:hypothetical protein